MPIATWVSAFFVFKRNNQVALRETLNKLHIMELVTKVESVLPKEEVWPSLKMLIDKSYALGDFGALWAVEGLGQRFTEHMMRKDKNPRQLLDNQGGHILPDKSLTMLHAGIGLAFAKHGLLGKDASSTKILEQTAAEFIDRCQRNSRGGYLGCAIESLGLVARFEHGPQMVRALDQVLQNHSLEVRANLWHGAGRATYFSPQNFIVGVSSPIQAIAMCFKEPPHELGHLNMLSGLAWAITLVNMKHPEVLGEILEVHKDDIRSSDAFKNGISSSVIIREDTTPGYAWNYIQSAPQGFSDELNTMWEENVLDPGQKAIETYHPTLAENGCLDEVFRYQDLDDLVINSHQKPEI